MLPVRKRTKEALAAVKGSDSFDDLLRELLDLVPPEVIRARLDARRAADRGAIEARRLIAAQPGGLPRRSAEKQLLIANLAEKRWQQWLRDGRVLKLGPRRYRWSVGWQPPRAEGGVRIVRRPGRGLLADEGPQLPR